MNKPSIENIATILVMPLRIPIYQRPYKWQTRHVQQLLQDLQYHWANHIVYRIGTVVFHQEKDGYDIVDGQQRLITLSLILSVLGKGQDCALLQQKLLHSESQYRVIENHQFIQNYVQQNLSNSQQAELSKYILHTAEMVCFNLTQLDEAFQFFDSQNAYGKPLEAYDLLKAYHLRAMQADRQPENRIFECVEKWENAALLSAPEINLHKIINQTLFPLRQWVVGQSGESFTSQDLAVFKGVSSQTRFPYMFTTQFAYSHFQAAFQINQTLLNGAYFFDYIEYYRQNYHKLFDSNNGILAQTADLNDINQFIRHHRYKNRTGDKLLQRLFECTVLAYYDKFGDAQLAAVVRKVFIWVYQVRVQLQRIVFASIDNHAQNEQGLLKWIARSHTPEQVLIFMNSSPKVRFENIDNSLLKILRGNKP